MINREHAHKLIDQMPESQISALIGFLETIVDPVTKALASAPLDDEPESAEERKSVATTRQKLARRGGKGIPHQEAMRRLGLG